MKTIMSTKTFKNIFASALMLAATIELLLVMADRLVRQQELLLQIRQDLP